MKLKDLELPCYVKLREDYGNPFRLAMEVVEVQGWNSWTKPTKKVVVRHVRLSADGSCVQEDDGDWCDKVTPGQIAAACTEEWVLQNLRGRRVNKEAEEADNSLYSRKAMVLIDALEAAGFAGFRDGHKGVTLDRAAVVRWLREHGEV